MKRLLISIFLVITIVANAGDKKPKYIFYFIGDGMGFTHVTATEMYLASIENLIGIKTLAMNTCTIFSNSNTFCKDSYITDSGASGTALATGTKTKTGYIGVDESGLPVKNAAEYAKEKGYKIGIISTVGLNHATPACFYAHNLGRDNLYEIGIELSKSSFDFFGGGGIMEKTGKEKNKTDIYELAKNNEFIVVLNKKEYLDLKKIEKKLIFSNANLDNQDAIPYKIDRSESDISLAELTAKATELLYNPKGFFIMIEGGKIDWAAHNNDAATVIQEVLDFDKAIEGAMNFYHQHSDETLIIITADHETGGMTLGNNVLGYKANPKVVKDQKKSSDKLMEEIAKDIKDTTVSYVKILEKIKSLHGIGTGDLSFVKEEEKQLIAAIEFQRTKAQTAGSYMYQTDLTSPVKFTINKIVSNKAGFGWTTHSHTGTTVPFCAIGVHSQDFAGYMDNASIGKTIINIINNE